MKYWVRYTVLGEFDSPDRQEEARFRLSLLTDNHWAGGMSYSGFSVSVTLLLEEELALLFRLKFGATLDPVIEVT